jgi:putative sigma-54 modulation protein
VSPHGGPQAETIVQIKIAARHGQLDADTQKQIHEKAEKLLHFFERITMIEITVDLSETEKHQRHAEVKVDAEHKHDFIAHEKGETSLLAVDKAIERVQHQIHKYKEKIQDHRRDASMSGEPARK